MAMTKAEKEEMERLKWELARERAMRFPAYSKPERMTSTELTPAKNVYSGGVVVAWHQWNYGVEFRVQEGCSNGINHSSSNTDRTTTQGGGQFYKSKLDALRVARIEITERFASVLATIDAEIVIEETK